MLWVTPVPIILLCFMIFARSVSCHSNNSYLQLEGRGSFLPREKNMLLTCTHWNNVNTSHQHKAHKRKLRDLQDKNKYF